MVFCKIPVVLHQMVVQGALSHHLAGRRGVDGEVDEHCGIPNGVRHAQGVGSEGQVVVPGQDGQDSILLVEEIIVPRVPQVAVPVHDKHLHGKIPQHLLHVHRRLQILPGIQNFERPDQPPLIPGRHRKFPIFKNVGVAVRIVPHIPQGHVRIFRAQGAVVRLVELAVAGAEVSPGKALLRLLHRQKQPPVLPVHRHPGMAAQGGRDLHKVHHVVDQPGF